MGNEMIIQVSESGFWVKFAATTERDRTEDLRMCKLNYPDYEMRILHISYDTEPV